MDAHTWSLMRDPSSDWGFRANPLLSAAGAGNRAQRRRQHRAGCDGRLPAGQASQRRSHRPGRRCVRGRRLAEGLFLHGRSSVALPVRAKILGCEVWTLYQTLLHVVPPVKALTHNLPVHRVVHSRNQTPRRCVEKDWAKLDDVRGVGTLFSEERS